MNSKLSQVIGRVSNLAVVFPAGLDYCIRAMDVLWPICSELADWSVQVGRDGSQGQ
jgi:hypothetical protein